MFELRQAHFICAFSWLKARSSAKPPIIGIKGHGIKVKRGVDYKIIDAPAGLQGAALTKVLNMAESVIIPVLPLIQIKEEDRALAEKTFEDLMGDNVAPRKTFIEENAHFAVNIDI